MKPNLHLKCERELHGWSQAKMAELLGTDPSTISRWECGFAVPSPYFREKLIATFGKSPQSLGLLNEDEPSSQISFHSTQTNIPFSDETISQSAQVGGIYDPAIPLPSAESRELIGRDLLIQQVKQHFFREQPGTLLVLHGLPGVEKLLWRRRWHMIQMCRLFSRWNSLSGCWGATRCAKFTESLGDIAPCLASLDSKRKQW